MLVPLLCVLAVAAVGVDISKLLVKLASAELEWRLRTHCRSCLNRSSQRWSASVPTPKNNNLDDRDAAGSAAQEPSTVTIPDVAPVPGTPEKKNNNGRNAGSDKACTVTIQHLAPVLTVHAALHGLTDGACCCVGPLLTATA
jgi:hypothetical protein